MTLNPLCIFPVLLSFSSKKLGGSCSMMSCTRTPSPTRARTRIIYRLSLVLKYIRSRHLDATRHGAKSEDFFLIVKK